MKEKCVFKESGIAWLGKIPKHWEVSIIRSCFDEFDKRCGDKEYQLLSITQEKGIVAQAEVTTKKDISNDDKSNYKIVPLGAIAYNKMRMWQGAMGLNNLGEGIVSPAYAVSIPNDRAFSKFFFYLFKTPNMIDEFKKFSYGLCLDMNSLRYEDFQKIQIPLPPLKEQKAIADFLDKKCELIEEFIIKKEQLITLLEEKKQALINEVVSKGLNKNAKFKESGIDYLGQIPTHWEVKKLKYIAKVVLGKMLCNEKQENYDYCFYLKSKNLQWLNVEISEVEKMWFSEYEKSIYRIKKGDLLVSEGGEVGKTCIWNNELEECYIQNSVHKITLDSLQIPKFFLYVFFSYGKLKVFESMVNRVSIAHLVLERLINIDFAVPPLEEQKAIATYLDTQTQRISSIATKIKAQIKLMREYKSSLISEAICGRMDF